MARANVSPARVSPTRQVAVSERRGGMGGWVLAAIIGVLIMLGAAWYVVAGGGRYNAPAGPSYAPSSAPSAAPAVTAPGAPAPQVSATPAPHYP